MNKNICMKKVLTIFCLLCFAYVNCADTICLCEEGKSAYSDRENVDSSQISQQEEDMFAPVELDLTDYTVMNKKNKKFKLSAEISDKQKSVSNKGQIWTDDKIFLYNYYSDENNLRSLPSYGSLGSYLKKDLDENTSVMVGQDGISSINGDTVNFAYLNSSYYSSGVRLDRQSDYLNYSVGAFNETDTLNQQMAAIVSTKPTSINNSNGKFYIGGGVFSNLMNSVNKNTSGLFAQYNNDRWKFGAQVARSSYSKPGYNDSNSAHFLTSYKINDHVSLNNKLVKNFSIDEIQSEVGVTYAPLNDIDRLQFELTAANYQSQNTITRQRLKFSTSFKF